MVGTDATGHFGFIGELLVNVPKAMVRVKFPVQDSVAKRWHQLVLKAEV